MNAIVLFTAEVFGVLLRVLECQGKRWLCAHDIAKVLEYSSSDSAWRVWTRHKDSLNGHSIKAKIGGVHQAVRLFDEVGLRCFCKHSQRPGSFHLLNWLDTGGLQAACDDVIPFDPQGKPETDFAFYSKPKSENVFVFEPHHQHKNILAFKRPKSASASAFEKPSTQKSLDDDVEWRRLIDREVAYCRDMAKVLLRYCGQEEIADVRAALEDQANRIKLARYSPGLNAALYDLYRRYWLSGGDV